MSTINTIPLWPVHGMNDTYPNVNNFICPDCPNECSAIDLTEQAKKKPEHRDVHGKTLTEGDTVTLIEELKGKALSLVIKGGIKIKNLRPVDDNLDIEYIVDAQSMLIKFEFIKKV